MLSAMASRRTVFLDSATYVDLTSTGNLRLIRDHQVRDRIVQYFSMIERLELILEKPRSMGALALARRHRPGSPARPVPGPSAAFRRE